MSSNAGLITTYVCEIVSIVGATIALLAWLRRRTLVSYRVAALGALGFVLSQVVHLPLNMLLGPRLPTAAGLLWVTALVLGLGAGLCEELTRYALLRTAAKRVRDSGAALMFGAGHGGIEALIVAGMASLALLNLLLLGDDPSPWLSGLTPEERVAAESGIEQLRAVPVLLPLVGALERVMVLPIHLAATLLVTLSVVRAERRWLLVAIGLHALLDGVMAWLLWRLGGLAAELWIGAMMVTCLGLLWWLERVLRVTPSTAEDVPMPSGAPVELVAASKRYGGTVQALSRATLTLRPGSRTCLLGPNGAGKTTAIRMLIGAIGASSGHAFLFGRASGDDDFLVAKRRLGVVPQLPGMYTDLRVRDWLELVRDVYGAGDITAVAAQLGLAELLPRPMDQLSGGQKRRVAIAAAVLAEPELLILDEPSAGLDPIAAREVLDYLGGLARTHTILLCTHDLVEAERLCERVVVMLDGRVLVNEDIETLRARIAPKLALRWVVSEEADTAADARVSAALDALHLLGEQHEDELWVTTTEPTRDAPRVLRALLAAELDVLECRVERPTLEALFLDIVRGDEAARADARADATEEGVESPSEREPMPAPSPSETSGEPPPSA